MPVGDRPVLDVVVRQLRHADFERLTVATGYLAELIEAFFGDGSSYGIAIDYFRETRPLGTAGSLALIDGLDDPFLVMSRSRRRRSKNGIGGAPSPVGGAVSSRTLAASVMRGQLPQLEVKMM
jgi:hypothetical protein